MTNGITDEAIASEALFDAAKAAPRCVVHSWHPPDSKAYFTRLLYLPFHGKRYHMDLVLQSNKNLYLVEVKGDLSNSLIDYEKLTGLLEHFTVEEMVSQFKRQGESFSIMPTTVIPVFAARIRDDSFVDSHLECAIITINESGIHPETDAGKAFLADTEIRTF